MLKKKLDRIHIDVLENDDGSITYQGAQFEYEIKVFEDDKHVGNLPPEFVDLSPEKAVEVLGESAGAHVLKLAEVEDILANERSMYAQSTGQLRTDCHNMEQRALAAEQKLAAVKAALGLEDSI